MGAWIIASRFSTTRNLTFRGRPSAIHESVGMKCSRGGESDVSQFELSEAVCYHEFDVELFLWGLFTLWLKYKLFKWSGICSQS